MADETANSPARRGPAPTKHVDILWAAAALFSRQGVAQTTTREIATAAQTTERTLFKHFGNKEALIHAVISEAVVAHVAPVSLEALRHAIESAGDDLAGWHLELLRQRMHATGAAPELTRLLLVELLRDDALRERFAAEWREAAWKPLLALFRKLQREGRLRQDLRAEALARMFLSLNVAHLVSRFILAPDARWHDDDDLWAIAALFARGAAPSGSRGPGSARPEKHK
jgi:AcrR family transcriptional regulator